MSLKLLLHWHVLLPRIEHLTDLKGNYSRADRATLPKHCRAGRKQGEMEWWFSQRWAVVFVSMLNFFWHISGLGQAKTGAFFFLFTHSSMQWLMFHPLKANQHWTQNCCIKIYQNSWSPCLFWRCGSPKNVNRNKPSSLKLAPDLWLRGLWENLHIGWRKRKNLLLMLYFSFCCSCYLKSVLTNIYLFLYILFIWERKTQRIIVRDHSPHSSNLC